MNPGGIDLALLRFALQHTDSASLQDFKSTRDPADYEWLKQVTSDTDALKMKRLLDVLKREDTTTEQKAVALEELQFYVEDLDNAIGMFHAWSISHQIQ